MPEKIVFIGKLVFFEGLVYAQADINMIADMRRKGVGDGKLLGDELEEFVVKCLRTADYRVLGYPMSRAQHLEVEALLEVA